MPRDRLAGSVLQHSGDLSENIPPDAPEPLGKHVTLHYVDANLLDA